MFLWHLLIIGLALASFQSNQDHEERVAINLSGSSSGYSDSDESEPHYPLIDRPEEDCSCIKEGYQKHGEFLTSLAAFGLRGISVASLLSMLGSTSEDRFSTGKLILNGSSALALAVELARPTGSPAVRNKQGFGILFALLAFLVSLKLEKFDSSDAELVIWTFEFIFLFLLTVADSLMCCSRRLALASTATANENDDQAIELYSSYEDTASTSSSSAQDESVPALPVQVLESTDQNQNSCIQEAHRKHGGFVTSIFGLCLLPMSMWSLITMGLAEEESQFLLKKALLSIFTSLAMVNESARPSETIGEDLSRVFGITFATIAFFLSFYLEGGTQLTPDLLVWVLEGVSLALLGASNMAYSFLTKSQN